MPNWCFNQLTLRHNDPSQLQRLVAILQDIDERSLTFGDDDSDATPGLLGAFVPQPVDVAGNDDIVKDAHGDSMPVWCEWALKHWGTKWDVYNVLRWEAESWDDQPIVVLEFETAWSPPIAWLRRLGALGFIYGLRFSELGELFAGFASNSNPSRRDFRVDISLVTPIAAALFGDSWHYWTHDFDEDPEKTRVKMALVPVDE